MRLLLINTAGGEGSVALADTEAAPAIVAEEMLPGRTSSERLVPAVRRLMEAKDWKLRELAAVVVVHGPGSFTGVRVGLSAAKGFSEAGGGALIWGARVAGLGAAGGEPLVGVAGLGLVAGAGGEAGAVHAGLDGGRGEFYYGEYVGHRCVREVLLTGAEVAAVVGAGAIVVCEAKVAEALAGLNPRLVEEPSAADALPF